MSDLFAAEKQRFVNGPREEALRVGQPVLAQSGRPSKLPAAGERLFDRDDERRPPRGGLQGGCAFGADGLLEIRQPTGGDGVVLVGELGGDGGGEVPADPPPQG